MPHPSVSTASASTRVAWWNDARVRAILRRFEGGRKPQNALSVANLTVDGASAGQAVDVSALDLGSNLHVSDLVVPPGIDVMSEADLTVATVLIPRGLRDEAAAAQDAAAAAPAAPAKAEKSE